MLSFSSTAVGEGDNGGGSCGWGGGGVVVNASKVLIAKAKLKDDNSSSGHSLRGLEDLNCIIRHSNYIR